MKKRILFLSVILILAFVTAIAGCSDSDQNDKGNPEENGGNSNTGDVITIDLTAGKEASCFTGLTVETLPLEAVQKGETVNYTFEGVSLDALLSNMAVSGFTKIELKVSDMEENLDVTDIAKAEAGVFVAWSESGEPETPARVFPKDAATGNLLTKNVTSIIVTK